MQDKTAIGNNENANTPSKTFREYIESLVEEIVINNAVFNDHKKYLQRYSQEEGLDYATLEKNLTDFFETLEELKSHESKVVERLAKMLGMYCYLEEGKVDELVSAMNKAREKEVERKAKKEAERKAKEEKERRAKEEADRIAAEKKAEEERVAALRKAEKERIAREKAEREVAEEARRKTVEEVYRKAREEAERKAREEAERKVNSSISLLCPIEGVVFGETKTSDMPRLGYKECFNEYTKKYYWRLSGLNVYDDNGDQYVDYILISNHSRLSSKLIDLGFDFGLSYNQCMSLLRRLGFTIVVKKEPHTVFHAGRNTLEAVLKATSLDGQIAIEFDFEFGNKNGEGYSVDSRNSLDFMNIYYLGKGSTK